jgi:hypothetical protein
MGKFLDGEKSGVAGDHWNLDFFVADTANVGEKGSLSDSEAAQPVIQSS